MEPEKYEEWGVIHSLDLVHGSATPPTNELRNLVGLDVLHGGRLHNKAGWRFGHCVAGIR